MKKLKVYIKYFSPIVLIGLIAFLYSFTSNRNSARKIVDTPVEFEAGENHFLTHEAVNKLLIQNEKTVKNLPKSMLDLHILEDKVVSNPYVEKATVYATLDGVLKTTIKQREPIARIVDKSNSYYIDKFGVKVPLSKEFSAHVPLVSGIKNEADIKELTILINAILADDFLKKEIVGITKNTKNEYEFNVRSGNYIIDFGNVQDIKIKFSKLKAFYNKAFSDESIEKYKKINVKYHNQVVCTK